MTSNKVRLVSMLCDGVIGFNNKAKRAIEEGDIETRVLNINKSLAIVSELSNALDMEAGGEVAVNLARLYDYMIERLSEANIKNSAFPLNDVSEIMKELKAGWDGVASQQNSDDSPTASSADREAQETSRISIGA